MLVAKKRFGLIHINSMRSRLRWGLEKSESNRIIIRPNVLEAQNAASYMSSMNRAEPQLGLKPMLERLIPEVAWLDIILGADRAGANMRLFQELVQYLDKIDNAAVQIHFCAGHDGQHIPEVPMKAMQLFTPLCQVNKVLRMIEHQDRWVCAFPAVICRSTTIVEPVGPEAIKAATDEALPLIQFISKYSLRRELNTTARYRVLRGVDSIKRAEELKEKDITELEHHLAALLHVQRQGFKKRRHLCDYRSDTPCGCKGPMDVGINISKWYTRAATSMFPSQKMMESRWHCWVPLMRLLFFTIMLWFVGPDAFNLEYASVADIETSTEHMTASQLLMHLSNWKTKLRNYLVIKFN